MPSPAIVKHLDVIDNILPGRFSGFVIGKEDSLSFQAAEKTFSDRIVPAIPFPAHAADHAVRHQHGLKVGAAVLAPSI